MPWVHRFSGLGSVGVPTLLFDEVRRIRASVTRQRVHSSRCRSARQATSRDAAVPAHYSTVPSGQMQQAGDLRPQTVFFWLSLRIDSLAGRSGERWKASRFSDAAEGVQSEARRMRARHLPQGRRKPLAASSIAAAVQRSAISAPRHRLTLRQTRRTVPFMFSMMLVQASDRRSSPAGRSG